MLRTLGVILGLGIIGTVGYLAFQPDEISVDNTQTEVTSTEAAGPTAEQLLEAATQKMIEEAVNASSTEIEAAKAEAASRVEKEMKLTIERKVRAKVHASNSARIDEIDKETKVY